MLTHSGSSWTPSIYEQEQELRLRGNVPGEVEENYSARVDGALEAGGDVQPRRRILHLLAYDEAQVEWTSNDVTALYQGVYGARDEWSFLLSALAALIGAKHGSILRRTGTPGRYLYKFSDPHMRPFLRLSTFPNPPEA